MTAPGNGDRRNTVYCSEVLAHQIRRIHRRAARQGRGKFVSHAFRTIVHALERDPSGLGEPAYRLPGLRMEVRTAVVQPLVIDYAICEDRPLVFIKGAKLLSPRKPG
jgi:hypothetical protein